MAHFLKLSSKQHTPVLHSATIGPILAPMRIDGNLTQTLLVASPQLKDAFFSRAVIYIHAHGHDGAIGIIINHPLEISLEKILTHLKIPLSGSLPEQAILMGGPLRQDNGFVLHYDTEHRLTLSSSKDTLANLTNTTPPPNCLVTLGYCAWAPEQLEAELRRDDWIIVPCTDTLLFTTPYPQRWKMALKQLGITAQNIVGTAGHV